MIKMSNTNITKRGSQATILGVMIVRCSHECQHWETCRHPANVVCSLFRYMNNDVREHSKQIRKCKDRQGRTINLHYTAIIGATLLKEDIGKEV